LPTGRGLNVTPWGSDTRKEETAAMPDTSCS
jgi:hypothetical protein